MVDLVSFSLSRPQSEVGSAFTQMLLLTFVAVSALTFMLLILVSTAFVAFAIFLGAVQPKRIA